jgi:hypothetical protein
MVDALGRAGGFEDGDGVVAGVAVKEGEANLAAGSPDLGEIGHAEAEEVAVEVDAVI